MRLEYTIIENEHHVFVRRIGHRFDTSMFYGDTGSHYFLSIFFLF